MVISSGSDEILSVSDIYIVRRCFLDLAFQGPRAGELFYQHLFAENPELRELFVGDISVQSHKLTNMLGMIVSQLHNMPDLLQILTDLAKRHVVYGVKAEHYSSVGSALLKMIEDIMGAEFDSDVELAWMRAYDGIAVAMIRSCFGEAGVKAYRSPQGSS